MSNMSNPYGRDKTMMLLGTHWELEKVIENMWVTWW
jgi:hypothetical protein